MYFKEIIESAFRELVNTKHLYQSVIVDFEPCVRDQAREEFIRGQRMDEYAPELTEETIKQALLTDLVAKEWWFGTDLPNLLCFSVPPVRLLCSVCDDIEPFNLVVSESPGAQSVSLRKPGQQVFWFPLQCQSCKNSVIVLLIRRIGHKITLVGRSEFEEVKAPDYIPKSQRRFYSQAVVACHAGHVLAGVFLLRTVIEQHMRVVTENSEKLRGDELCEAYANHLPASFKQEFPSLKKIYKILSDAMHSTKADNELFESQRGEIERHFDALRLFKIHQS